MIAQRAALAASALSTVHAIGQRLVCGCTRRRGGAMRRFVFEMAARG